MVSTTVYNQTLLFQLILLFMVVLIPIVLALYFVITVIKYIKHRIRIEKEFLEKLDKLIDHQKSTMKSRNKSGEK